VGPLCSVSVERETELTATTCAQPDRPAAIVRAAAAAYPAQAVQQHIGGVVRIRVTLDAAGHVSAAAVADTPDQALDGAALDAARASTYRTALRHCIRVASDVEFRVLFDPNRSTEPAARPLPLDDPAPIPRPAPVLAQPWKLTWSVSSMLGFGWTTLSSNGSYVTTAPYLAADSGSCSGRAAPAMLARVSSTLAASTPQFWHDFYGVAYEEPSATPAPSGTPPPVHDAIAIVPQQHLFVPSTSDLPESRLELTTANGTYATAFTQTGSPTPGWHMTVPPQVQAVVRELARSAAPCPRH